MGRPEFKTSPNMKTFVLMIKLTPVMWSAGKEVIMDSSSCVLKGILEMRKRVVYVIALIKKTRNWIKGVHQDIINDYFGLKIDDVVCLSDEWEESEFNVFVKDPDHNVIMMSIFYGLTVTDGQKQERSIVNKEALKFKYPEVVTDHYIYRGLLENPNASRHDGRT